MIGFLLGVLVVVILGYFMGIKRYNPTIVLFFSGATLLILAQVLNISPMFEPDEATGFVLFDAVKFISEQFASTITGVGLTIMSVGGFGKYMSTIGASDALVNFAMKPLAKLKNPYILLALAYVLGAILKIFISSASGLGVLLMVSMYPVLRAANLSKASSVMVIAAIGSLDMSIGSPGGTVIVNLLGLNIVEFMITEQLQFVIPVYIVVGILIYFVNIYFDKKEGTYALDPDYNALDSGNVNDTEEEGEEPIVEGQSIENDNSVDNSSENGSKGNGAPTWYAFLIGLPLVLAIVFSPIFNSPIQIGVVPIMFFSFFVAIFVEIFRSRSLKKPFQDSQSFFEGMGTQFVGVVSLIAGGATFAEGLIRIGTIDYLIDTAQSANLGVVPMMIVMVLIVGGAAVVSGSGNAVFPSFALLVPDIAKIYSVNPLFFLQPMEMASSLMRTVSPILGAIIAISGMAKIDTFQVVKRTAIPMTAATILVVIMSIFIYG